MSITHSTSNSRWEVYAREADDLQKERDELYEALGVDPGHTEAQLEALTIIATYQAELGIKIERTVKAYTCAAYERSGACYCSTGIPGRCPAP